MENVYYMKKAQFLYNLHDLYISTGQSGRLVVCLLGLGDHILMIMGSNPALMYLCCGIVQG